MSLLEMGALAVRGGVAGLVLNVLLDQLLRDPRPWHWPRCPRCGHALTWWQYGLGLRPCPVCGLRRRRPWVLPLVLALATLLLARYPDKLGFWPLWIFLLYTVFNVTLDLEHRVLLPDVELIAALMALAFGWWRRGWLLTLLGGGAGVALMAGMYLAGVLLARRWVRQGLAEEGEPLLGSGDVFLAGVLGLFLGWPAILAALVVGIFLAGAFSLGLIAYSLVRYRQWPHRTYIPYAPFLLAGTWWVLYL